MEKIARNSDLAWQNLGDQTVIIDARLNKEVHRLNELGTFLREKLGEISSVEGLLDCMTDEYDVDLATARMDVEAFLSELKEKSLVHEI